jgi:hypothetical protein
MPGNPESSYSPAASGAGPPFRVIKAQTIIDGVPTLVDLEVIAIADKDGNLFDLADMESAFSPRSKVFKDIRKFLKEIARDPSVGGRVTRDLALITDVRRGKVLEFAVIDTATTGDQIIVKATKGTKIKVCSYVIVATAAVTVRWKSSIAGSSIPAVNLSGPMAFAANGGVSSPAGHPGAWLMDAPDDLVLNLSGSFQVSGHVTFFREP